MWFFFSRIEHCSKRKLSHRKKRASTHFYQVCPWSSQQSNNKKSVCIYFFLLVMFECVFWIHFGILTHFTVATRSTPFAWKKKKKTDGLWRNRREFSMFSVFVYKIYNKCISKHVHIRSTEEKRKKEKSTKFIFGSTVKCVVRCTLSLVLSEVIDCSSYSLAKIVLFWFRKPTT